MLEDLIEELKELQEYKEKYYDALADKRRMSDKLYEYAMNEYNRISYEERKKCHINEWCRCCKYKPVDRDKCDKELPEDINVPIPSNSAYFPQVKHYDEFDAWDWIR